MLNEDDIIEAAGPILFLAQRARLAALRKAAETIPISQETEAELERLLGETESLTQMLLMPTNTDEVEYLDDLFDDELIDLCAALRVNLVAWVNQPQILIRFRDPDAVLSRWLESRSEYELKSDGEGVTPVMSKQVAVIESAIRSAFDAYMTKNML
jgi:hypothetical protein